MGQQIGSFFKSKYTGQQIENMLDSATNIADQYDPAASYVVGDLVLYNNGLYVCTGATTGTFDPAKWDATSLFAVLSGLASSYTDPNSDGNVVIGVDSTVGEKILRSLTFPGLTNRYYLPFAQYIRERLQNDPSAASFSVEIPDAEEAPMHSTKIKGATAAQNQLVVDGGFTDATNWAATNATLSLSNNVARSTCTTAGLINIKPAASVKYIAGHVYYQRVYARTSTSEHAARLSTALSVTEPTTTSNSFVELEVIGSRSTDTTAAYPQVIMQNASVDDYIEAKWMVNFDLTARGFTAAEYASPSALKAAWLKKYGTPMPLSSPHDLGSIANVDGVYRVRGRNLWDEEWELGGIDGSTGQNVTDNKKIRSKNYVRVISGETYYGKSTGTMGVRFYDANKQFLSTVNGTDRTFEVPSNAVFLRFQIADTTTYANNICINLSDSAYNGNYEPFYNGGSVDCSTAPLNGIGTAQDEKDFATGTMTTKTNVIDLGSLTYNHPSTNRATATVSGIKNPASASALGNYIAAKYVQVASNATLAAGQYAVANGTIYFYYDGTDPTGDFCYELATPTASTETPQPVYTEYGYNVLEPVSGGVQSAEVDAVYYENIAGYIDKRLNG